MSSTAPHSQAESEGVDDAAEQPGLLDAQLERRSFIGYVVKGSGLAVALTVGASGLHSGDEANAAGLLPELPGGLGIPELADELDLTDLLLLSGDPFYYDYLIRIEDDNRVRFELPRMEVGQGIITAAVMIVAEELDVAVDMIDPSLSPAEIRRQTGQITGGSHSISSLWDPLRKVTAALRTIIVAGAAQQLGVAASQITTLDGIASAPDGRTVRYADVSNGVEGRNDLARTAVPKDPADYRVVGQPTARLDARDIVTGKVQYAMDMDVVPDAMPTVVARPPTLGGTVASFDDTIARSLPGVIDIAEVPTDVEGASSGVAVIARTFGEAFRGPRRARDPVDRRNGRRPLRRRHHRRTAGDQPADVAAAADPDQVAGRRVHLPVHGARSDGDDDGDRRRVRRNGQSVDRRQDPGRRAGQDRT